MSPTLLKSLSNDDDVNEGITFLMEFFQCTRRWEGNIVGYPAQVFTQKISDFQHKNDKEGSMDDNENAVARSIGIEWTNVLEISENLSHPEIKALFEQGLLDVRISQDGLWEVRKVPTPFPLRC